MMRGDSDTNQSRFLFVWRIHLWPRFQSVRKKHASFRAYLLNALLRSCRKRPNSTKRCDEDCYSLSGSFHHVVDIGMGSELGSDDDMADQEERNEHFSISYSSDLSSSRFNNGNVSISSIIVDDDDIISDLSAGCAPSSFLVDGVDNVKPIIEPCEKRKQAADSHWKLRDSYIDGTKPKTEE